MFMIFWNVNVMWQSLVRNAARNRAQKSNENRAKTLISAHEL